MRITLITRRFPPLIGGAEKVLSYLGPALADEGAEVTVLTSMPPGLDLPEREEVPSRGGALRRPAAADVAAPVLRDVALYEES